MTYEETLDQFVAQLRTDLPIAEFDARVARFVAEWEKREKREERRGA